MKKMLILLISLLLLLSISGCQSTEEKIANHLNNKEYLQAYELAAKTSEEEMMDKIVLQWQQTILENETIDEKFADLNMYDKENMNTFASNVLNYLFEKKTPNKEQIELIYSLFDGVKEIRAKSALVKKILVALDNYSYDEKIWIVEERETVSYEEYFSKEHLYSEETVPTIKPNEEAVAAYVSFDELGMLVNVVMNYEYTDIKKQYVLFGQFDYNNTATLASDGYWTYVGCEKEVYRININGEKEILYTLDAEGYSKRPFVDFVMLDHDVALLSEVIDDKMYIHRIYLPEKKIETFETMVTGIATRESGIVIEQKSSNHILYFGINPAYLEKVDYLKQHQDLLIDLYKKHIDKNLDEEEKRYLLETLENPIDSSAVKKLKEIIEKEYGIYSSGRYDYNVLTKKTEFKQYVPEYPQGIPW
jgi:hypothetical protein